MTERPINLRAWEVRAFIEGRKTRITRPISEKVLDAYYSYDDWCSSVSVGVPSSREWEVEFFTARLPFSPCDLLWCREAFIMGFNVDDETGHPVGDQRVWYRADKWPAWYDADSEATLDSPPWRSSAVMPRALSRLTLAVEAVKVCRVQDITEEEAIAEGATSRPGVWPKPDWSMDWSRIGERCRYKGGSLDQSDLALGRADWAFASQFNEDHGLESYDSNPWVASYTVRVGRQNIDKETT